MLIILFLFINPKPPLALIRILIIEDNATILGNTAELLELEGYRTYTALDRKEGLEKNTPIGSRCNTL